ncbi:MAG: UDP-N-acetylmuramoyl-L-alanyl-D-glutamate--2,6-diaminopimelate ligase [Chitinivibrionales bacterium]
MQWNELTRSIPMIARGGEGNPEVSHITYDSRRVSPATVFVAIPGFTVDGETFVDNAIAGGAVAIVSQHEQRGRKTPWIQVENARQALGLMSKAIHGVNLDGITCVGVTGTNGKTSTVYLYNNLFARYYGEDKAWMFGTVKYQLGETVEQAPRTTPESSDLFVRLGAAATKPQALAMEVSSHALKLHRVAGFTYDLAVWTNLTQDHLDFHGTMEEYYQSKKALFTDYLKENGIAVINIDDQWGRRLAEELQDVKIVGYGRSEDADVRIEDSHCTLESTQVTFAHDSRRQTVTCPLAGEFNVYNIASFYAGAQALNIPQEHIVKSLETMQVVPGRMETVRGPAQTIAIVDYAHTPDALEKVLAAAQPLTGGRLFCVFGCGGDRDRSKRPLMAEAVARYCDEAIVTSDNPRSENPKQIIKDIIEGIPLDFSYQVVEDRREAIGTALSRMREGDTLVVAGKGHETYQEVNGVRRHFDDREVVRELTAQLEG